VGPFRKQESEQGTEQDKQGRGATPREARERDGSRAEPTDAVEELARLAAAHGEADPGTEVAGSASPAERRRRLAALTAALRRGAVGGGAAAGHGLRVSTVSLAERLIDAAPRIPVRDLATLRAQHPDVESPEELAERIVSGAVRAAGAVGAGVGTVAMLPTPPVMPVEIAADVLGSAAIEYKMIAELYAVYGQPATGGAAQRAGAYLAVWANRKGLDLSKPAGFAALSAGSELRRGLRRRITRTSLRKLPAVTPLLLGAAFGAQLNRRDTRRLAEEIRRELRRRAPADPLYWAASHPPITRGGGS